MSLAAGCKEQDQNDTYNTGSLVIGLGFGELSLVIESQELWFNPGAILGARPRNHGAFGDLNCGGMFHEQYRHRESHDMYTLYRYKLYL